MQEDVWADALRRERRGDGAGYEAFLHDYARALRRIVSSRLASAGLDSQDTEDVIQEVLIAIHTRRDDWDDTRPLLPWLGAITRYKVADAFRRRRTERRLRVDLSEREWQALLREETAPAPPCPEALDAMLSRLPPGERDAVRQVGIHGLTHREAAGSSGRREGAVRVAFHRGLARLRAAVNAGDTR